MTAPAVLAVLAALALVPVMFWLVERLLRDPVLAAVLVLGLSVWSTLTSGLYPPLNLGGAVILERDLLFALLVGAGILRLLRHDSFTLADRAIVMLILLIGWSALRGIPASGLEPALRETRIFLYYFGGILYFTTMRPTAEERERIVRVWVWAAIAFAGIVVFRWAALAVGLPQEGIFVRDREPGVRVIDAQNTLVIAQAMMLLAPGLLRKEATRLHRWVALGFVPILVGLQHRTIWVVLLLGAMAAGLRYPRLARKYVAATAAICLTGIVVLIALSGNGAGTEEQVAVQQNPLDEGSIMWRLDGWRGLLEPEATSAGTFSVGAPMGGGYARELQTSGVVRDTSPHNFYIQTYLRLGIIGVSLLGFLLFRAISGLRRPASDDAERPSRDSLLLAVLLHAVFMLAWGPDMEQGMLLGVAIAAVWRDGTDEPQDVPALALTR